MIAAAAARILSIDGAFANLDDQDDSLHDVISAPRLGFHAKPTLYPGQSGLINRIFSRALDEIEYARTVVEALNETQAQGHGSVAVGGQRIDLPIGLSAQRVLELVRVAGSPTQPVRSQ